jgi:hypothetical protein
MHPLLVRILNCRWAILALMFLIISMGIVLGWFYYKPGATLGWCTAQYFFSYQDLGFVSRGLVATVLHPFPFFLSTQGLLLVTVVILVSFVVTFWNLFERCTKQLDKNSHAVLALVFLLAPSTLVHVGLDYGRFDPLNLIFTIVAARCLQRSRDVLAALLVTAALLVHEGFLILEFPLLCAYLWSLNEKEAHNGVRLERMVRFVLLPTATAVAVLAWGKYGNGIDTLVAHFETNALYRAAALDGEVNRDALLVIVRTLKDNFDYNIACFQQVPWINFALMGLWFCAFAHFYDRFFKRNKLQRDWLYYSSYSPLLMNFIACDYFRWVALTSINMLIVLFLKMELNGKNNENITIPWESSAKIIAASCLLGPIAENRSFFCFIRLLKTLWQWLAL